MSAELPLRSRVWASPALALLGATVVVVVLALVGDLWALGLGLLAPSWATVTMREFLRDPDAPHPATPGGSVMQMPSSPLARSSACA